VFFLVESCGFRSDSSSGFRTKKWLAGWISPFFAAVAGHEVASRANVADAKSLLCGFYASDSGRSHFDGREVTIGCTMLYINMGKSMGKSMNIINQ